METPKAVAETLQETAKEKPKDAKFESSRNLRTEDEMSPSRAPTDLPNRGGAARQIPKARAQPKSKTDQRLFTLNQKDLVAELENQETLTPEGQGIDSTGFYERLKRGEMLKINAGESDYAQFIKRMKEKLIQHWSPQKVVSTEMYQYNEVRVDVAVILNPAGEIIELRVLNGSLFPRYDQESLRALREAGPFPNPHKSLIQDDGLVYMPWTFTLYMGGNGAGAGIQ
jgi:TonB family protein